MGASVVLTVDAEICALSRFNCASRIFKSAACFFSPYARVTLNDPSVGLYILSRHPARSVTRKKGGYSGHVLRRPYTLKRRQTRGVPAVLLGHQDRPRGIPAQNWPRHV